MNKTKLVAIDLAKRCYQVGAFDERGQVIFNRKLSAAKFPAMLQQLEPTVVAMEACAAAHFWARRLQAMGHEVRLIPPQHAKAFRRVHKSDAHDVISIFEAARRPNLHFVPVKTVPQQDLQALGRIRERLVAQRTATINQARGLAREYGVDIAKTPKALLEELPLALGDAENALSHVAREALDGLLAEIRHTSEQVADIMRRITALASLDPAHDRLLTIPGIGPTIAPALLASLGHAQHFKNARSCAAWAGLVPRQHGTGGKTQLGGITKNGNRSLRVVLIHGARAVIRWADRHDHAQSRWITQLIARRGKNKAVVALANKLMRVVWVVLTQHVEFDMRKAFRPQPAAA